MTRGSDSPLPVTVVGGYLGAGKTTLVNALLRDAVEPIAVLVNDFGSINIDVELIESDDGTTIALSNGCICCSLVDGFASALQQIRATRPMPARVLVEASGVADPTQVAAYAHAPGFALDGVVVLVDGVEVEQQLGSELIGDVVSRQLEGADLVVMTKADLGEQRSFERTRAELSARFGARVVTASAGTLPSLVVFGAERGARAATANDTAHDLFETWDEHHLEPIDRSELEARLDALPERIVRAKGFVRFTTSPERMHVVQVVGRRWSIEPHRPWDGRQTTLVFIERKRSPESHR